MRTNPEMCLVRDKDEMLPLHFAAMRGRVGAIEELIKAKPDSIREMTKTDDVVLNNDSLDFIAFWMKSFVLIISIMVNSLGRF